MTWRREEAEGVWKKQEENERRQVLKLREEKGVNMVRWTKTVQVYRGSAGFSGKDINGDHLWKSL